MKALGAVLILCGAALQCGMRLAMRRRERAALRELAAALEGLARVVHTSLAPLPRLLARRGGGEWADAFFADVLTGEDGETPLPERWRAAARRLPLDARERQTVGRIADALGSDEDGLLRALRDAAGELRDTLALQESAREREGRLSVTLSLSMGLLLTILLF